SLGSLGDELQVACCRLANAGNLLEQVLRCPEDLRQRAEPFQQRLGGRLGVGARNGTEENEFEQFVIGERVAAGGREPLAQALAMAVKMRFPVADLTLRSTLVHRAFPE